MLFNKSKNELLLVITLLAVSGCTDALKEENTQISQIPIVFGTQIENRAAIGNDKKDMERFTLWGWVEDGGKEVEFFKRVSVSPEGDYGDKRFWAVNKPYDFYALHPEKMMENSIASNVSCNEKGELRIIDFNASKTGKDATDLMVATQTNMLYDGKGTMQPVPLKFNHELAQVKLCIKTGTAQEDEARISNVKLFGTDYKGDLSWTSSLSTWTNQESCTDTNTPFYNNGPVSLAPSEKATVLDGILLLPQAVDENITVSFTYNYISNSTIGSQQAIVYLSEAKAKEWEKGKIYQYNITLPSASVDTQIDVTISPWEEEDIFTDW